MPTHQLESWANIADLIAKLERTEKIIQILDTPFGPLVVTEKKVGRPPKVETRKS